MKKLLALALSAIMCMGLFAGCSSNSGSSDTVVLGCDVNFAPMGFMEKDEVVGFDIDLAKEVIEKRMGKTLKIQPITWSNKEAELSSKKVDVLWNGLTMSPARMESMCFTEAYLANKQIVIVKKDSDIKTVADLEGKKVGMQKESTAVAAFAEKNIATSETVELKDNVACLNELKTGRVDAVIMDSVVGEYYLNIQAAEYDFTILDEDVGDELYGIATEKSNTALRDEIQKAMDEAIADGTAAKISEKWFGEDRVISKK